MIKKQRKQKSILGISKRTFVILLSTLTLLAVALLAFSFVPIEKVRVGECGNQTIRVSLMVQGRGQIDQAKSDEKERLLIKEESLKNHPGLAMGCSAGGKTYLVYLL